MRKIFFGLGIVMAVLICICLAGAGVVYVLNAGRALDTESKTYVDNAVISISARWDKNELLRRATPELKQKLKPDDIDTLFDALANGLGPLVEYRGSKGQAVISATIGTGAAVSANYLANGRYKKGDAEIRISLLKVDGLWKIHGFFVNSTALVGNLAGRKS